MSNGFLALLSFNVITTFAMHSVAVDFGLVVSNHCSSLS